MTTTTHPSPAARVAGGSWRRPLLLALPCLTCAGQLPVLLAVLAVTGWAGPLSPYFGIAAVVLGAVLVGLLVWGARRLSQGEERTTP